MILNATRNTSTWTMETKHTDIRQQWGFGCNILHSALHQEESCNASDSRVVTHSVCDTLEGHASYGARRRSEGGTTVRQ
jgi:hypothetical protein